MEYLSANQMANFQKEWQSKEEKIKRNLYGREWQVREAKRRSRKKRKHEREKKNGKEEQKRNKVGETDDMKRE